MKNKGFTLIELLAVISIITIIMSFAFPSFLGLVKDNKEQKYIAYENSMQEYAKAYFGESKGIISLSALIKEGLPLNDKSCIGYVDLDNKYKPYLKCGDEYKTDGFDIKKAN